MPSISPLGPLHFQHPASTSNLIQALVPSSSAAHQSDATRKRNDSNKLVKVIKLSFKSKSSKPQLPIDWSKSAERCTFTPASSPSTPTTPPPEYEVAVSEVRGMEEDLSWEEEIVDHYVTMDEGVVEKRMQAFDTEIRQAKEKRMIKEDAQISAELARVGL